MSGLKKYSEQLILIAIMLLAALLRFNRYANWSLSNDELSAISRLNFSGLHELIKEGVRPDYHPAGVQVFLFYWVKIFGNAVWAIRLPFVLCGILSVYYTYLIAKRWFSVQTAQFSALALACLTYPILYSQLARPYAPGLLFSLTMVHYWSKLLFDTNSSKKIMFAYAISTALCMYSHYFSFLFAIIVGITGLFYMKAENYKDYILAGIISVALFIPHISITTEQLSRGGIGSWLGKPNSNFFTDYLYYSCNGSQILLGVAFVIIFISVLPGLLEKQENKFRIISLSWFMLPFLIGYFYSIHVNPVLQYSVLLFSFPFLLMFFFSYLKEISSSLNFILLSVFATLAIWTGVSGQNFYSEKPFASFKELSESDIEWANKYGVNNIHAVYNLISPAYLEYYFTSNLNKISSKRSYFRGDDTAALSFVNDTIQKLKTKYLIYGWSNNSCPPEIYEIIRSKYPKIVEDHIYFNSRITLFENDSNFIRKPLFVSSLDLDHKTKPGWNYNPGTIDSVNKDQYFNKFIYMDNNTEYSAGFEGNLSELCADSLSFLNITANVSTSGNSKMNLVLEFHKQGSDSMYDWHSALIKNKIGKPNGRWETILLTEKIPAGYKKGDKIKVYVWNPDKKPMVIANISITSYSDMNYEPKYELK